MNIKVNDVTYKINTNNDVVYMNGVEVYGYIDYEQATIDLDARLAPDRLQRTLWHEILHAILFNHKCNADEDYDNNEELIEILARGLNALMKDNKLEDIFKEVIK